MNVDPTEVVCGFALALLLGHGIAQIWLEAKNRRWLQTPQAYPAGEADFFQDPSQKTQMVAYQLAKSRLEVWEIGAGLLARVTLLFSGFLPWYYLKVTGWAGFSLGPMVLFFCLPVLVLTLWEWPFDYYRRFQLEERHGFNTMTPALWWRDKLKELILSAVLGLPLLTGLLWLVETAARSWWFWGWFLVFLFQLLLLVLAPWLILPLFNRFEPLPEGTLRDRLMALASRLQFPVRQIQVMDGSKRSRHSNAFFTGFGRTRRIVLYDTLVRQLSEPELGAVVAHEIGHAKLGHIPKMIAWSGTGLLVGFYLLFWLSQQPWFYRAFGFEPGHPAPAFIIFGLLGGAVTFWGLPVTHAWSRRREFEADAFAAQATEGAAALKSALKKLNAENLSQAIPDPIYRWFYYSHPALPERLKALDSGGN